MEAILASIYQTEKTKIRNDLFFSTNFFAGLIFSNHIG